MNLDIDGINDFYSDLEKSSKDVSIENVGKTYEGRDIKVVKINNKNDGLPAIVLDAGVHAR